MSKQIVLLFLVVLLIVPLGARADEPFFQQRDKQEHIAASFALMMGFSIFMSKSGAAAITAGIGLGKEYFHDKEVDPGDIVADTFGIVIAIPVSF